MYLVPCQHGVGVVMKTCFLKYIILYEPFKILNWKKKKKEKVKDVNLNSRRSEQLLGLLQADIE